MADNNNNSDRNREIRELRAQRKKDRRLEIVTRILLVAIIVLAIVLAVMIAGLFRTRKSTDNSGQTSATSQSTGNEPGQPADPSSGTQTAETSQTSTVQPTEAPETVSETVPEPTAEPTYLKDPVYTVSPERLYSECAYMVRVLDHYPVLNKFGETKIYPASMTKMMTAIVVLENLPDLQEKLTVTYDVLDRMYEQEASIAGFEGGEEVSVIDLLYGALLPSGAECCDVLAERVAGSVDAFVDMMNAKAAQLGMNSTHFMNTTGLHSDNHFSSCKDIATLLEYALQNPHFQRIITATTYTTAPSAQHPDGLTFNSTLFYNMYGNVSDNGAIILGGKTGTTDEAGKCLATFGMFQNDEYILVTAQAWEYGERGYPNIQDAVACYSNLTY